MAFSFLKLRIALLIAILFGSLAFNRILLGRTSDISRHKALNFTPPPPVVTSTLLHGDARDIFQKVNLERKEKGLKTLKWHDKLSQIAANYSKQMATENFFSHFDGEGRSLVDRAKDHKLGKWLLIGENLFMSKGHSDIGRAALREWKLSESHRLNMLDPEWTHTGIGIYKAKNEKTYVTQVFMKK